MTRQTPLQLDTLREVKAREHNQDSLQELPGRFWEDAGEYIDILSDRIEDAQDGDSGDSEPATVVELREERETALDLLEGLADKRKAKIVKLASFAASDMVADTDPMTPREEALFTDLQDNLTDASLVPDLTSDDGGESGANETAVEVSS